LFACPRSFAILCIFGDGWINPAFSQRLLTSSPVSGVWGTIPTGPSWQSPAKAVITAATSPGVGAVHLEFSATHATSYDVLHEGPGDPAFTLVADDIIVTTYNATGLVAGAHECKVLGRNSRGTGPESDVSGVNLA